MRSWFAWTMAVLAMAAVGDGVFAYERYFALGVSFRTAIVLQKKGVEAETEEWRWVEQLYPGTPLFPSEHATTVHDGRIFELLSVNTPRGQRLVYFDPGIDAK